ncbi:unnamed protein product, partial [Prorocentrum cordatum]
MRLPTTIQLWLPLLCLPSLAVQLEGTRELSLLQSEAETAEARQKLKVNSEAVQEDQHRPKAGAESKRGAKAGSKPTREARQAKAKRQRKAEAKRQRKANVEAASEQKQDQQQQTEADAAGTHGSKVEANVQVEAEAATGAEQGVETEAAFQRMGEAEAKRQRKAKHKGKAEAKKQRRRKADAGAEAEAVTEAEQGAEAEAASQHVDKAEARRQRKAKQRGKAEARRQRRRKAEAGTEAEAEAESEQDAGVEAEAEAEADAEGKQKSEAEANAQVEAEAGAEAEQGVEAEAAIQHKGKAEARRQRKAKQRGKAEARRQAAAGAEVEAEAEGEPDSGVEAGAQPKESLSRLQPATESADTPGRSAGAAEGAAEEAPAASERWSGSLKFRKAQAGRAEAEGPSRRGGGRRPAAGVQGCRAAEEWGQRRLRAALGEGAGDGTGGGPAEEAGRHAGEPRGARLLRLGAHGVPEPPVVRGLHVAGARSRTSAAPGRTRASAATCAASTSGSGAVRRTCGCSGSRERRGPGAAGDVHAAEPGAPRSPPDATCSCRWAAPVTPPSRRIAGPSTRAGTSTRTAATRQTCDRRGPKFAHWCGAQEGQVKMLFVQAPLDAAKLAAEPSTRSSSALPVAPTEPGCYSFVPYGCPQHPQRSSSSWKKDAYPKAGENQGVCEAREKALMKWCGTSEVKMLFVHDVLADEGSEAEQAEQEKYGSPVSGPTGAGASAEEVAAAGEAPSDAEEPMPAAMEAAHPEVPAEPGCYVFTPQGCPQNSLFQKESTTRWVRDVYGEKHMGAGTDRAVCEGRGKSHYAPWCGTPSVETVFVAGAGGGPPAPGELWVPETGAPSGTRLAQTSSKRTRVPE